VFIGLCLVVLTMTAGGHIVQGDEETMYQVTQSIVEEGRLSIGREEILFPAQPDPFLPGKEEVVITTSAVQGRDGQLYSKYGIGQSLAAIPLYLLGSLLSNLEFVDSPLFPDGWVQRLVVSMLNPLALAGCIWMTLNIGETWGYSKKTSRLLAVASVFSTMLWPYNKSFYPQPGVTFLMLAVVYAAYRWKMTRRSSWLWSLSCMMGLMILFRLTTVIVLPAFVVYLILCSRGEKTCHWLFPLSVGVTAAVGITTGYNWLRFDSLLETGYHEAVWDYPPLLGLYGLLFSPGKGVFLYAPLIILGLLGLVFFIRYHQEEGILISVLWVSFLAFYAPYSFWTGGFNWGPRFLMPVVPLAILPIGILLDKNLLRGGRQAFLALFFLGVLIQLPAVVVDHSRFLFETFEIQGSEDWYDATIYDYKLSPVFHQWQTAAQLVGYYRQEGSWDQARNQIRLIIENAPAIPNGVEIFLSDFFRRNTIDFWWLNVFCLMGR
jgi:hypothetical protein